MNNKMRVLLTGLVTFTGGLVVGALMAPKSGKESRQWIQSNSKELKDWAGLKGSQLIEQGESFTREVKRNLQNPIPDLYKATEDLQLDDDDLTYA